VAGQMRHLPSQSPVYTFFLEPAADGDFLHNFLEYSLVSTVRVNYADSRTVYLEYTLWPYRSSPEINFCFCKFFEIFRLSCVISMVCL